MIGHRMWATLATHHDVYGTIRKKELGPLKMIPGISAEKCFFNINADSLEHIETILQKLRPDIVLNCIGIVKQLQDANDPLKSIPINALFPHQLAKLSLKNSARMIQFSSDCVFDGLKGKYKEDDFTNANDLYGKTKALGEINNLSHVLTIRTSSIGREVFPHGGLFEWVLGQNNKEINGFSKAIYSGFPTHRLAQIINEYILPNDKLSGILHIASEPIDKYHLLKLINDTFGLNIKINVNNDVFIERSLCCDKFKSLTNFKSTSWQTMINDLAVDFDIYQKIQKIKQE